LCLDKVVINDNGGTAVASNWTLSAAGPTPISGAGGVCDDVDAGTYTLSESAGPSGYVTSGLWDCVFADGTTLNDVTQITLDNGESATCTITNDDEYMPGEEICRTAGFWGTHAGEEKSRSQNITKAVIDEIGGCLEICGEMITAASLEESSYPDPYHDGVDHADSPLEALCVHPRGNLNLQLARQLTAMALNCIISGGGPECQNMSCEDIFNECNNICGIDGYHGMYSIGQCIAMVDSWNNGGYGNGCHSRKLCSTANDLCFQPPGPAGSSKACKYATRSECTIIYPYEEECDMGLVMSDEDEDWETCIEP
jgi:hypothetical protein